MSAPGIKVGILLSAHPASASFGDALLAASSRMTTGATVYLYCIDDAVAGLADAQLQELRARGLVLYACAYAAQRRGLPINDLAVFAGLGVLGDILAGTSEFLSFNGEAA